MKSARDNRGTNGQGIVGDIKEDRQIPKDEQIPINGLYEDNYVTLVPQ